MKFAENVTMRQMLNYEQDRAEDRAMENSAGNWKRTGPLVLELCDQGDMIGTMQERCQ